MKVLWMLLGAGLALSTFACDTFAQDDEVELPRLERRNALVRMVEKAKRSVVFIECVQGRAKSQGSGVVVYEEGYVLTNYHVVPGPDEGLKITVKFDDGRAFTATRQAYEIQADLALLKITSDEEFPRIELGDEQVYLAETVVAIGNPLGHTHSVSMGIVSGLERDVAARNGNTQLYFSDLIQTDAAINSGNSGGPLLNVHGELIGINTVVQSEAENIGFAIPVSQVDRVLNGSLIPKAQLHASLGFDLGVDTLEIAQVLAGGPAAERDVRVGDRVVALAGKAIAKLDDWKLARAGIQDGAGEIELVVERGEERLTRTITPWNRLDTLCFERFGALVEPVTFEEPSSRRTWVRRYRTLLRITRLRPDGPADSLGMKIGDMIDAALIPGKRSKQVQTFRNWYAFPRMLARLDSKTGIVVNFYRDGDGDGALNPETELYEGRVVLD